MLEIYKPGTKVLLNGIPCWIEEVRLEEGSDPRYHLAWFSDDDYKSVWVVENKFKAALEKVSIGFKP